MKRIALALMVLAAPGAAAAAALTAVPSDIVVRADLVDVAVPGGANLLSPTVIDGRLYVTDQVGSILQQTSGGWEPAWGLSDLPAGVRLPADKGVLGVASSGAGGVIVVLNASEWPSDTPLALTVDPSNRSSAPHAMMVYDYRLDGDGRLHSPKLIAAVESRAGGHRGGGLLVETDGHILVSTGDHLPFDGNGGTAAQDVSRSSGKLLRIDPASGAVDVVARGLRNSQRMIWADAARDRVVWSEMGAATAEELNSLSLAALRDLSVVENFGWGVGQDGLVREGLFFVDNPGGGQVRPTGAAPTPDPGFEQPFATWGRSEPGFFAITGPVTSDISFDRIDYLVSDLARGALAAVVGADVGSVDNQMFQVGLVDDQGAATDLATLAGGRPDPRFFTFADGTAGVLLERNGALYRLTELAPVPLPAGGTLMITALGLLGLRRIRL